MLVIRFAGIVLLVMCMIVNHYVPYFIEVGGWLMLAIGGLLLAAPTAEPLYQSEIDARNERKRIRKHRARIRKISLLRRLNIISDTEYQRLIFNV